jgi:hypothetical protein
LARQVPPAPDLERGNDLTGCANTTRTNCGFIVDDPILHISRKVEDNARRIATFILKMFRAHALDTGCRNQFLLEAQSVFQVVKVDDEPAGAVNSK